MCKEKNLRPSSLFLSPPPRGDWISEGIPSLLASLLMSCCTVISNRDFHGMCALIYEEGKEKEPGL